jgi:hypothetical protein
VFALGTVGGEALVIQAAGKRHTWALESLYEAWHNAIGGYMDAR